MNDFDDNNPIRNAYYELALRLTHINAKTKKLATEIEECEAEAEKISIALDSLKPLVTNLIDSEEPIIVRYSIKWKERAKEIIQASPGTKYVSPILFDMIHPNAKNLSELERRRSMVNLSAALRELVNEKEIESQKATKGKGYEYFTKDVVVSSSSEVSPFLFVSEQANNEII